MKSLTDVHRRNTQSSAKQRSWWTPDGFYRRGQQVIPEIRRMAEIISWDLEELWPSINCGIQRREVRKEKKKEGSACFNSNRQRSKCGDLAPSTSIFSKEQRPLSQAAQGTFHFEKKRENTKRQRVTADTAMLNYHSTQCNQHILYARNTSDQQKINTGQSRRSK